MGMPNPPYRVYAYSESYEGKGDWWFVCDICGLQGGSDYETNEQARFDAGQHVQRNHVDRVGSVSLN